MFASLLDTLFLIGQAVCVLALFYGAWLVHGDTLRALFGAPSATRRLQPVPLKSAVNRRGYVSSSTQ